MSNPAWTDWLVGRAVGATVPNLNDGIAARASPISTSGPGSQQRIAVRPCRLRPADRDQRAPARAPARTVARSLYREWFVRRGAAAHRDGEADDNSRDWMAQATPIRHRLTRRAEESRLDIPNTDRDCLNSGASATSASPSSRPGARNARCRRKARAIRGRPHQLDRNRHSGTRGAGAREHRPSDSRFPRDGRMGRV